MFIPIADDPREPGSRPIINRLLIASCIIVFIYELSLGDGLDAFLLTRGTVPQEILAGQDLSTLVTAMFLHGGWMHIIGNMIFLRIFGDNIEARIGHGKYLLFYLLGGIIAGLVHVGFNAGSGLPSIGASGAISAVMGAYLLLYPRARIQMLYLRTMQRFSISAQQFLLYRIATQFLSSLGELSGGTTAGVAWWAHI